MNKLLYNLFVSACLFNIAGAAQAAGTLHIISSNGPPALRYNIVIVAEGYKSTQQAQFRSDATNALNTFFAREPFREYQKAFNGYAISVASTQAGADHPSYGVYKDTFFNSTYDASDRVITIPKGTAGQLKLESVLNTHVPSWNLAILLVNDAVPGGSDGSGKTAISSVAGIHNTLIHEAAHVLAGLGDEYTTPNPGYPDTEEPNTTRETNRAHIKWKAWIADETPIPTPAFDTYSEQIGLFEGAHYHTTGWYRPKLNCTMQSQYTPEFCEVCREALVLAVYAKVRPITLAFPTPRTLNVTNTNTLEFRAEVLKPESHSLAIHWLVNGVSLPISNSPVLSLHPAMLPNGSNNISVVVTDPTPFVRTDPTELRTETMSWTVHVSLSPALRQLTLSAPEHLQDGGFAFTVTGAAPQAQVEISTNLVHWAESETLNQVNGSARYTNASIYPGACFFRVRSFP